MSDLQRTIHSAYAFVRGVEVNRASAALTLDHMIEEQIRSIKAGETRNLLDGANRTISTKPSKLDQLDGLERSLDSAMKAIREAGDDPEKLAAIGLVDVKESGE